MSSGSSTEMEVYNRRHNKSKVSIIFTESTFRKERQGRVDLTVFNFKSE